MDDEFCLLVKDTTEQCWKFFIKIDGIVIEAFAFLIVYSVGNGTQWSNLTIAIGITNNE